MRAPFSDKHRLILLACALALGSILPTSPAPAQTVINVTVANDTGTTSAGATAGAGSLSAALAQINGSTPPVKGRFTWLF